MWSYAVYCAIFQNNCLPKTGNTISGYTALYGKPSPLKRLRVFGSEGIAHIPAPRPRSMNRTSIPIRFLGYSDNSLEYIVQSIETPLHIFQARTIEVDEHKIVDSCSSLSYNVSDDDRHEANDYMINLSDDSPTITNDEAIAPIEETTDTIPIAEPTVHPPTPPSRSPYNLRPRKKKVYAALSKLLLLFSTNCPSALMMNNKGYGSYRDALLTKNRSEWQRAYDEELRKLEQIGGLTIVKRPPNVEVLPFLEVLTEKIDPILQTNKFKVRLAARGDLQRGNIGMCYSPVPALVEQRLFLAMCIGWKLHVVQGDISCAFLHGRLSQPVYFGLPSGHPQSHDKSLVYSSPAAVYGLKDSGRIWYKHFSAFLKTLGFTESVNAPGFFVLRRDSLPVYLCLYVDDFLMASLAVAILDSLQQDILNKFPAKFTSKLDKFVGIEFHPTGNGCYLLNQVKMLKTLKEKYEITGLKIFSGIPVVLLWRTLNHSKYFLGN